MFRRKPAPPSDDIDASGLPDDLLALLREAIATGRWWVAVLRDDGEQVHYGRHSRHWDHGNCQNVLDHTRADVEQETASDE